MQTLFKAGKINIAIARAYTSHIFRLESEILEAYVKLTQVYQMLIKKRERVSECEY